MIIIITTTPSTETEEEIIKETIKDSTTDRTTTTEGTAVVEDSEISDTESETKLKAPQTNEKIKILKFVKIFSVKLLSRCIYLFYKF